MKRTTCSGFLKAECVPVTMQCCAFNIYSIQDECEIDDTRDLLMSETLFAT